MHSNPYDFKASTAWCIHLLIAGVVGAVSNESIYTLYNSDYCK